MEDEVSKDLQESTALNRCWIPKGTKDLSKNMLVTSGRTPETLTSGILCPLHHIQLILAKSPLLELGDMAMSVQVCRPTKSITKWASAGKINLFEDFFEINTTFPFQKTSHCILLCWFPYPQFLWYSVPNCSSRKTHVSFLHKLKLILLVHPVFRAPRHSQTSSDLRLSVGYPKWKTSASKAAVTLHVNSCSVQGG